MDHILRIAKRNAQITGFLNELRGHLSAAKRASSVVFWTKTLVRFPRYLWSWPNTETEVRDTRTASREIVRESQVALYVLHFTGPLIEALADAAISHFGKLATDIVSASWLFQWLTKEPEPEFVVINLKDTVSVGPVIAVLGQYVRWYVPASHRSTAYRTVERLHQSLIAAPIRAVSIVIGATILTNLGYTLAIGEPTESGTIVRMILLGLSALGTRISMSWDALTETRFVQITINILTPPGPPENRES